MRSEYIYTIDSSNKTIRIYDKDEGKSVTNDAENVIKDFVKLGVDVDNYTIWYRDTCEKWDILNTNNNEFCGFLSGDAFLATLKDPVTGMSVKNELY